MRMVRWASEMAVSTEDGQARMGVAALAALSGSELLPTQDQDLAHAVLDAVLEEPLDEIEAAGEDVEVVELDEGHGGWDSD